MRELGEYIHKAGSGAWLFSCRIFHRLLLAFATAVKKAQRSRWAVLTNTCDFNDMLGVAVQALAKHQFSVAGCPPTS